MLGEANERYNTLSYWFYVAAGIKKDVIGRLNLLNWWSWRDLNPRPENVYLWYYMLSLSFI